MLRLPCKLSRTFMDSSLRPSNLTIERSGYRWTSDRAFDQQLGRSKDLSFKSSRSSQIFFCVVNSWKNFFFLGHEATELKFTGFISSNFDQNAERENTRGWCCWYDSTSEWEYWTFPFPSPPPPLPLAIRLARHINYNLESLHVGSLLTVIKNKIPCRQLWQTLRWRFSALLISIVFTSSKFKALSWCFNGFIKHGEDSDRSDALYHRPLCIFRCANLSLLRLSQRFL